MFSSLVGVVNRMPMGRCRLAPPARQRQQIDADIGAALETFAPVPDLLTSTGRNAPD